MLLTEQQKEVFAKVFKYLKAPCASIWIAGGAVADYSLCTDIDVWFGKGEIRREMAEEFLKALPYYQLFKGMQPYTGIGGNTVVGEGCITEVSKPIQVILTEAVTPMQAMAEFDLSCHAWAVSSREPATVIAGAGATLPWYEIKLIKPHYKTLGRYLTICWRYGHDPDPAILKQVSQQ